MTHITERGKKEGGEREREREGGRERVLKDSERGYKERIKGKDTHIYIHLFHQEDKEFH